MNPNFINNLSSTSILNMKIFFSNESQIFLILLITILIDFTKQQIKPSVKCIGVSPLSVPNSKCHVHFFQQKYRSNDWINYSIDCKHIESHKQINSTIDWIHKNYETICQKKYSKIILKEVNVSRSDSSAVFESIDYLDKSLERLLISETFLTQIPNKLFEKFEDLKHLNLSFNNLTEFDSNSLFSANNRLVSLDLSHNLLNSVELYRFKSLESLWISDNHLKTIKEFDHKLKSISLANNDWECDKNLIWLFIYTNTESNYVLNRDKIRCKGPEEAEDMTFDQRLFVLKSDVCGQCQCSLLRKKSAMSVNCSDKELSSLPSRLPSMTKIVKLDNNDIKNISLNSISLNDWRNVSYLYLNNNTIESFVGLERINLLKNLVALNISHNRLREIPYYILDQLEHLDELYLSENPWRCDCNTFKFQEWLQKHFKSIKDIYNIRCGATDPYSHQKPRNGLYSGDMDNKLSNRIILKIPQFELCPQSQQDIDVFEVINWLLSLLILVIIIKLIYDYFWQKRTGKLPQFFKLNI